MKSIFATIFAVAATVVSAQTNIVSITSPLTGTVYTAGQAAIISWIDPTVSVIPKITLAQGNPDALLPLTIIAENIDASNGSYVWNIPGDTAPGNDYAFEIGNSPDLSFTGLFTIQASNNITPATAAQEVAESAAGITKANVAAIAVVAIAGAAML